MSENKQNMNPEALYCEIKQRMNYKDDSETCGNCKHYVEADMSGELTAKGEYCVINVAIELPVDSTARCDNFIKKYKK